MTMTLLIPGLVFGVSASFISWILSMLLSPLLRRTPYYDRLSSLDLVGPGAPIPRVGMRQFKWVVTNTPFKFFNPAIRVAGSGADLALIRDEMTKAEVNHLIGFALVTLTAIVMGITEGPVFGMAMMVGNVLLNLYPSLLQQENKRRIYRVIRRREAAAQRSPTLPDHPSRLPSLDEPEAR